MKLRTLTTVFVLIIGVIQAEDGYFWHVSDHHIDTTYWSEMRSCSDEVPVRGIYGDYWCDSPWRLVNDSIVAMGRIKKDVDFILWTGDNVPHIKDEYINETYNLYILRSITEGLTTEFPGVKTYATMGNHDWWPSGQFPDSSHRLYNDTADLWAHWIDDPDQLVNFRKGAYYTVKTPYGLRIIGLNTNVYYTFDKLTKNIADPVGQFAWLEGILQSARTAGEKVLITAHIPPGIHSPDKVLALYDNFNVHIIDIFRSNADIIVGMFFGHEHEDIIRHLKKSDGSPGVAMYLAPSITPWRFKFTGRTSHAHNPGIRLVKYNRNTSVPLEIQQYYMDLTESNSRNSSNWTLAYTTSQAYGMTDLSAVSLDNTIQKLRTDKQVLDMYIRHQTVLANGDSIVNSCDATCRAELVCSFDNLVMKDLDDCIKAQVGSATRLTSSSFSFMFIVIGLFLLQ